MSVPVDFLKANPYFAGLGAPELEALSRSVFENKAERGVMIILEGKPSEAVYFIASGVVKVFKTSADGKEQILQLARPGDSFNDVPVLPGGMNEVSAQAVVPSVLYGLKKKDLETLLREHPQLSLNVIRVLSQKVQLLMSLVEDLSFKHVVSRVARILLDNAVDGAGQGHRLTQQEMAAMAGTAREIVGRSLKSLEDEGLIKIEHHSIIITGRKALGAVAGGGSLRQRSHTASSPGV